MTKNIDFYENKIKELEDEHHFALSKISHEIRNPVTLINSFLQLIESKYPEVSQFDYWSDVTENLDFLISLLEDLSNYNNAKRLHLQYVNLYQLLTSLEEQLTPTLSTKNISLVIKKESAVPLLSLDLIKIKAAFFNVLRNASEAIVKNGKISVTLFCDGEVVVVKFANNGPCIPADQIDTLFEPFITHKKEGSGLGLAIVKNVVDAHNGLIKVNSQPEHDTIFSIILPI